MESPVATHSSSGCPAIQVGNLPVLPVLCLYLNLNFLFKLEQNIFQYIHINIIYDSSKISYILSTKFLAGFNMCKFVSCRSAIKFSP